jgi:predicted DCC family thiol-disulfide oxidoreductase YuxK
MEVAWILYDADCGFCRVSLALVLTWDRRGRLRPVALQDPETDLLLTGMPEERRMGSWHLVTEDGEVESGGAAFAPLLRRLPGGKPLAALTERFPGAADRGYSLVASERSRLGRLIPAAIARWADRLIARR